VGCSCKFGSLSVRKYSQRSLWQHLNHGRAANTYCSCPGPLFTIWGAVVRLPHAFERNARFVGADHDDRGVAMFLTRVSRQLFGANTVSAAVDMRRDQTGRGTKETYAWKATSEWPATGFITLPIGPRETFLFALPLFVDG